MIRAAIIDDSAQDRELLANELDEVFGRCGEAVQIEQAASAAEWFERGASAADIIFLDIDMPGMDGITAAKRIRETDDDVVLVFVTNLANLAIKGYEVQASDFLVKPVFLNDLYLKMHRILKKLRRSGGVGLEITTVDRQQTYLNSDGVLYIEVAGHYLTYHTADGVYTERGTISQLESRLSGHGFVRCNNCFLVNLKAVTGIRKDDILIGTEEVRISRPRKKDVMLALSRYLGGQK